MSDTKCREMDERLAELVDAEPAAMEALGEHLASCAECRAKLEHARKTAGWLRRSGDAAAPAVPEVDALFRRAERQRQARTRRTVGWVGGAVALAASLALVVFFVSRTGGPDDDASSLAVAPLPPPDAGRPAIPEVEVPAGARGVLVAVLAPSGAGVEVRGPRGTTTAAGGTDPVALEPGTTLVTDPRAMALVTLADGSTVTLDRGTSLAFDDRDENLLRVAAGQLLADVIPRRADRPKLRLELPTGSVQVLGTRFQVRAADDEARVDVARGTVEVRGKAGDPVRAGAGMEAIVPLEGAPTVAPIRDLSEVLAWADEFDPEDRAPRGLGSLTANPPGRPEKQRTLTLEKHDVRVRIQGPVARTEVEEVFKNDTNQQLEGVYRFPLPPGASIARLALEVDGKLEEGAFVESERATRIWRGVIRQATPQPSRRPREEYIWVPGPWRDPALLQWQKGNQFELKIFPIEAHSSRRVIIAYTEVLRPVGTHRRYVYPLPFDEGGSTKAARFDFEARLGGADPAGKVRSLGYEIEVAAKDGQPEVTFSKDDFSPTGDLVLDYALPDKGAGLSAVAYRPPADGEEDNGDDEAGEGRHHGATETATAAAASGDGYVLLSIRPDLPIEGDPKPRDLLLVVDASYSAFGERFAWQTKLVRSLVEQMDERDRFQVLACDLGCRALWSSFQEPSAAQAEEAARRLGQLEPGQATDLGAAFEAAARELRRRGSSTGREARVVYVGDGVASAGELDAGRLVDEALAALGDASVRVTTVGAGAEADELVLTELARRGEGSYLPFTAGRSVRSLALATLSAQYGAALEDARLSLPAGFSDPQPRHLPAVRAGEELLVVARMEPHVAGEITLKGTLGGADYEQRYTVDLETTSAKGNAFVPRVWAEAQIAELTLRDAAEHKDRIVELSRDHHVLSRFTSLLVLESEAMYRAFDIERPEAVAGDWTGEDAIETQDFDGSVDHLGLLGSAGGGRAAAGPPPASRASAAEEAPAMDSILLADGFEDGERARRARSLGPSGGSWMRRTWERRAAIGGAVGARNWDKKQVEELQAKYEEQPESRDRTKALYLALSRAGELDKALELAEQWWAKDRLDPEALERMALSEQSRGHGERALRLLGSMADLTPRDAALQERLALAYAAAGRTAESCAHRRAVAALKPDDADATAAAYQCQAWLGKTERADALVERFGNEMTRARLRSRLETSEPVAADVRGDLRLEATWDTSADLDLVIVHPDGRRSTWMGGVTGTAAKYADDDRRETLGFRRLRTGTYRIELVRHDLGAAPEPEDEAEDDPEDETGDEAAKADETGDDVRVAGHPVAEPDDDGADRARRPAPRLRTIRGELRIGALGQSRRVEFTLEDDEVRTGLASVEVTRFEVMVPVDGPPPPSGLR
ncbi:MAG: FecR domain-containing protein [Deltaproteobacteria bacterium]|nr:FecR domain-containing protein [Deltaproteobacteria bacterium]